MSRARQALGKIGEDLACREAEKRGYEVIARRYRRRAGEIDIIVRDGATLVFVEVKTREGLAYGAGGDAVGSVKRRRLVEVAIDYLARRRLTDCPCRFDVVAIDVSGASPAIEWYPNAFEIS